MPAGWSKPNSKEQAPNRQVVIKGNDLYCLSTKLLMGASRRLSLQQTDSRGSFLDVCFNRSVSEAEISLGELQCACFISGCRQKVWWTIPSWGSSSKDVPRETSFLLIALDREHSHYAVILPLVGSYFRSCLRARKNALVLSVETCDPSTTASSVPNAAFIAHGENPFTLLQDAFAAASDKLKTFKTRQSKPTPQMLDEFGWCTWNAFYENFSSEGVKQELTALRDAGVPPQTLIVDDGWQELASPELDASGGISVPPPKVGSLFKEACKTISVAVLQAASQLVHWVYIKYVRYNGWGSWQNTIWTALSRYWPLRNIIRFQLLQESWWTRLPSPGAKPKFEASVRGGGGVREFVRQAKEECGVRRVLCWHALTGYWCGVAPNNPQWPAGTKVVYPKPSASIQEVEPQMVWDPLPVLGVGIPPRSKIDDFYRILHSKLASWGVDGVKIDAQSVTTMLGEGNGGSASMTRTWMNAMEASVDQHFGQSEQLISCMCHAPEPLDPPTFAWHVVSCAFNSLFIGEIGFTDWDMFHTVHDTAAFHASARAVGGCPIYISDKPGEHNFELIRRLVLPDGSVLRAEMPGRPTRDCLMADVTRDMKTALKIWNENKCNGVVGAFNAQGAAFDKYQRRTIFYQTNPAPVQALVRPLDVETIRAASSTSRWLARAVHWSKGGQHKGEIRKVLLPHETLQFQLDFMDSVVCSFSALHSIKLGNETQVEWAAIGLEGMLNGGAAVLSEEEQEAGEGGSYAAVVEVKGQGNLLVYCSAKPAAVLVRQREQEQSLSVDFATDQQLLRVPYVAGGGEQVRVSVCF